MAISADSHVVEGAGVFSGLADRFGDDAPRVISEPGKSDFIAIPSRGAKGRVNVAHMGLAAARLDRDSANPLHRRDAHKPDAGSFEDAEIQAYLSGGYQAMRPGLTDGAQRGADQDIDGVEFEFLYPGYFAMFSFPNVELLVALQQNYNDWLFDHCSESGGRLYGLAALPVQDPEAAIAELDRVIKKGYKGAVIPCTSPADRPYYDTAYDPLWARAAEANFPLSLHVGCASYVPKEFRSPKRRDSIAGYAGTAATVQDTLIEFMCRGVCQRHPTLTIVVAEFNAGWIAHWLDRVDQGWQRESGRSADAPAYESIYDIWHRQFYATIEDDQPALRTRDLIGEDRLMWGSDYPHTDSTWPCSQDVLTEMFVDYPDGLREKITRTNVQRLYGLA
ncbi:MAG: amidohydrolase family protein [Pseudomonadota bacterium]